MSGLDRAGFYRSGMVMTPPPVAGTAVHLLDVAIQAELTALRGRVNEQALDQVREWWVSHRSAAAWFSSEPGNQPDPALVVQSRHEISTDEAAGILHVSRQHVGKWCRAGRLEGRLVGGRWLVDKSSVLALCVDRQAGDA